MNLIIFFVVLSAFRAKSFEKILYKRKNNRLDFALKNITKIFNDLNSEVSVMNFGNDTKIIDWTILKAIKDQNVPCKVKVWNKTYQRYIEGAYDKAHFSITHSGTLSFDSINSLINFNNNVIFANLYSKSFYFLVHCQKVTFKEIAALKERKHIFTNKTHIEDVLFDRMNSMEGQILQFQYFLLEEESYIRLVTFVWYTPGKCNIQQLIEVNRFSKLTGKWKNSNFMIKKFENFHGCRLNFAFHKHHIGSDYEINSGALVIKGQYVDIMKALGKKLNFTTSFDMYLYNYGFIRRSSSIDFFSIHGCLNFHLMKQHRISTLYPFDFISHYISVPPAENYSEYEKLLLPFDNLTWTLILITFFAAYASIFIIKSMKINVQKFVFGGNVSTPSLNVTMIFFGISQVSLPSGNFARFIVMLFILFCLILRTAWQGKMFEFIQKNVTKVEIQSIDEMIEKNFTFYMFGGFIEHYPDHGLIAKG